VSPFLRRNRQVAEPAAPPAEPGAAPVAEASEQSAEDVSPLVDRLRRLEWPSPPEDVRERCLDQVMARAREQVEDEGRTGDASPDAA
jgi:hypothetical protein